MKFVIAVLVLALGYNLFAELRGKATFVKTGYKGVPEGLTTLVRSDQPKLFRSAMNYRWMRDAILGMMAYGVLAAYRSVVGKGPFSSGS